LAVVRTATSAVDEFTSESTTGAVHQVTPNSLGATDSGVPAWRARSTAQLTIESTPSGAVVLVDDLVRGTTPLRATFARC
jgi:hypothetical protein